MTLTCIINSLYIVRLKMNPPRTRTLSSHRILKDLGRNLRALRLARGVSQTALERRAKLARSYIEGVESGTRNPTISTIFRLARALDAEPAALFAPRIARRGRKKPKARSGQA